MFMFEKPDLIPKVKSLRKEYEQIDACFYATEIECFKFFENSNNSSGFSRRQFEALQKQVQELRDYYGSSNRTQNLSQLFREKMNKKLSEENQKQEKLNQLNDLLSLIEIRNQEKNDLRKTKKVTIVGSLNDLRNQLEYIKQYFESIKLQTLQQINQMKAATKKLIDAKQQEEMKHIQEIDKEIENLRKKKEWYENIPKYVKETMKLQTISEFTFTIHPDYSIINQYANDIKTKSQQVYEKHQQKIFDPNSSFYQLTFGAIFEKLNVIEQQILRIQEKLNKLKLIHTEIKSKARINYWAKFVRMLFIYSALNERTKEIEEEEATFIDELEHQRKLATEIVPGTNMTVLELRKSVAQLSKKVSEEKRELSEKLRLAQEEHQQYQNDSRKEIEQLEKENNDSIEAIKS